MPKPRELTPDERKAIWNMIEKIGSAPWCPIDGNQLMVRRSMNDTGGRPVYFVKCSSCGLDEIIE